MEKFDKEDLLTELFGEDLNAKKAIGCGPLYTTLVFPHELNLLWSFVRDMPEKEFEQYAMKLRKFFLDKFEKENFPVGASEADENEIIDRLRKFNLLNVNTPEVFYIEGNEKILKGYNQWGTVIDHWFPEMLDTQITRNKDSVFPSIMDTIRDERVFMKNIKRILWRDKLNGWRDEPNKKVWPTLKQSIRMGVGTQPVTNIRPAVAKWIYQKEMLKYLDNDVIVVYDPSMGWAGRLVGFLSATGHPELKRKKCIYIGTDPNTKIFDRYSKIVTYWKTFIDGSCTVEVYPICCGSEDFDKTPEFKEFKGKGILAYTSPPYFNRERYSNDEQQSYLKFDKYNSWRDGFLDGTIKNVSKFLQKGSRLYWNAANLKITNKIYHTLETDSIKKAEKYGMKHIDTIKMLMRFTIGRDNNLELMNERKSMNIIETEGELVKYEPVLIFQK